MSKYRVNIQPELNNIKTTPYGKVMRPNLHDALEKLARKQNALSDTFDNMIIDAGNNNGEIVDSRNDNVSQPPVNYPTLGDRLDAMQQQIAGTNNTFAPIIQEVEQARGNENSLGDRLDKIEADSQDAKNTANTANQTANDVKQEIDDAKAPNATLKDKLDSIEDKFDGYLPLAGGTMTGTINYDLAGDFITSTPLQQLTTNGKVLTVDRSIVLGNENTQLDLATSLDVIVATGGQRHRVWHEGNAPIDTNATIVKRVASGNINVGKGVAFNDVVGGGAYLGGIGIDSGNSHGVPYTDQPVHLIPQRGHSQIWTNETMPVQTGDWTPQFTASNGGTVAYNSRGGKYHRVGNMVIVTFNLIAVNPVNFNGQINVTNLPFANATGIHVGCSLFAVRGFNVGAEANNRQICAYIRPGESRIIFNYSDTTATTSNIAVLEHSHLLQNNQIEISATAVYKINP